ncbi:MAG: membrane protein insertion efficiency factor YidD [Bdellovibrionales bacterium]|nr:membrane protein insertion efficiency factor YidD [Bdellovibrionales bacterium]
MRLLIRMYQIALSPFLPASCRFHPTCSHYALEAFEQKGALKALGLTLLRLSKCHPFHPGGFDPVPQPKRERS